MLRLTCLNPISKGKLDTRSAQKTWIRSQLQTRASFLELCLIGGVARFRRCSNVACGWSSDVIGGVALWRCMKRSRDDVQSCVPSRRGKCLLRNSNRSRCLHLLCILVFSIFEKLDASPAFRFSEGFVGERAVTRAMWQVGFPEMVFGEKRRWAMLRHENLGCFICCIPSCRLQMTEVTSLLQFARLVGWINLAISQRPLSRPLGNTGHDYVRDANLMVSRAMLLAYVCCAIGLFRSGTTC